MIKPLIALIGRPNVGKSTLFNQLAIGGKAIVHSIAGVTRDRKYSEAILGDFEFVVVDTPGWENSKSQNIQNKMTQQTMIAINESNLVFLIVDNIAGIIADDLLFAKIIHKLDKKCIVLVNKCENGFIQDSEYYKLGFDKIIPISSAHKLGFQNLYHTITEEIKQSDTAKELIGEDILEKSDLKVAIIGRPNVGKSSFLNNILKDNRVLVSENAGTTRESIAVSWKYKNYNMSLIDTAGLNRRCKIRGTLEKLSSSSTINTIHFTNVVILMLDAERALEKQDLVIANYALKEGKSIVIVLNKWDLVKEKTLYEKQFLQMLNSYLSQIKSVPVLFISALYYKDVSLVLEKVIDVYKNWCFKISTNKLNKWLADVIFRHPLPLNKKLGRNIRIKYITQIGIRPPTFMLFSNDHLGISDSYKNYLLNSMRDNFGLYGVPIRLNFTKSSNPYK